jgi:hypothetical protein
MGTKPQYGKQKNAFKKIPTHQNNIDEDVNLLK